MVVLQVGKPVIYKLSYIYIYKKKMVCITIEKASALFCKVSNKSRVSMDLF